MSTFLEVKTEVENKVGRSNSEFTSHIGTFVNDVCNDVTDEMNFWFMKRTTSYDLTSGDGGQYTLLELTKEVDEAYLQLTSSYKKLEPVTLRDALVMFEPSPTTGEPDYIVIENDRITLFPPPDASYTMRIVVWSRFEELVEDGDTNFLLTFKKKLVVAGALSKSFAFLQEYEDSKWWGSARDNHESFENQMIKLRREHNSRILNGEITLVPKSDVKATNRTERHRTGSQGPSGYY